MLRTAVRSSWKVVRSRCHIQRWRAVTTLAIETSCDDTSVAVISVDDNASQARCTVRYHRTITAKSQEYNGIHPIVALDSHQTSLAKLVEEARSHLYQDDRFEPPTFVSATRGPGMRSSLATGLMMAKGLSVAWNVPLVGVHHMQAHSLTPRLCNAMTEDPTTRPSFPYLTVLVSGGHTMLLCSKSLVEHEILAETQDIAIGDCIDKAARAILPPEHFIPPYGKALEQFAFPNGADDYDYVAPRNRGQELERRPTRWKWALSPPLAESGKGDKSTKRMIFSFSGLLSSVKRLVQYSVAEDGSLTADERTNEISIDERREMARQVFRLTFEHMVSRIMIFFSENKETMLDTIVVSGGVAANRFLHHVLRQTLDARGLSHVETVFPPVELCTDNALMIAWAGMEMFKAGYTSDLDITPIRKWSMSSASPDGGILGVDGWKHESTLE